MALSKRKRKNNRVKAGLKKSGFLLLAFFTTLFFLSSAVEEREQKEEELVIENNKQFVEEVANVAIPMQETHGLLPSVTIAQAILESDWGKSGLAQQENNYYGIKGNSSQSQYATLEYDSEWKEINASFRSYASLEDSVHDYGNLLVNGTEWNADLYQSVIDADNYKEAAHALSDAGYATDPDYPEKIIRIIQTYNLMQYDS